MILPSEEMLQRRRRGYQRRGVVTVLAFVAMVLSALLPHVGVQAFDGFGRSLIGASRFFVRAQPTAEGFEGAAPGAVALALDVTYLGLAAHQVGLLGALGSFWVLAAEGVGRWIRRLTLISGWLLAASAVLTVTGFRLLEGAGVPARLGSACAAALLAGLILVLGGLAARERLDSTWYWTKPDLNG